MISHEILLGVKEGIVASEVDRRTSIGVVLVIVAASESSNEGPLVWTVLEQQGKEETDKIAGQISLPAETRKVGEGEVGTLLAALGEMTDSDDTLGHFFVDPDAFYAQAPILVKGKPADVAFLVYDGPLGENMQSVDVSETVANGWMHTQEIQRLNGELRPAARDSIEFVVTKGVLDSLAGRQRENLIPLSILLEPGFSIKSFIEQRETKPDISLV